MLFEITYVNKDGGGRIGYVNAKTAFEAKSKALKNVKVLKVENVNALSPANKTFARGAMLDSALTLDEIQKKYCIDAYNLGMETKEFDPKAPLKVLSVTTRKEPDGISGSVTFTKGKKKTSERFMVYKSGNWDMKPGGFGVTGLTAGDKEALMNAVRKKLATMGIKAK